MNKFARIVLASADVVAEESKYAGRVLARALTGGVLVAVFGVLLLAGLGILIWALYLGLVAAGLSPAGAAAIDGFIVVLSSALLMMFAMRWASDSPPRPGRR